MKQRMKQLLARFCQPQRWLIFLGSFCLLWGLQTFISDLRIQVIGLFVIFAACSLFIYHYTDDFPEKGIFSKPLYNLVSFLICQAFLCLILYVTNDGEKLQLLDFPIVYFQLLVLFLL